MKNRKPSERSANHESSTGLGLHNPSTPVVPARGAGAPFYALSSRVLDLIHQRLETIVEESQARCALLIDRTGCIMASAGDFHPVTPSTMGATAAATIAALNSMVARASSPEVSVKFYGSEIDRIHFCLVEERLVLCVLHGKDVSHGNVRALAKEFVSEIGRELAGDRNHSQKEGAELLQSVSYIENKLDALFKDGLFGSSEDKK